MPHERIPIHWLIAVLAVWPLLWLALFYGYVLLTTLYLQHAPSPGSPNPSALPYTYYTVVVTKGYLLGPFVAVVFALFMALAPLLKLKVPRYWMWAVLGGISFAAMAAVSVYDPGHYLLWLRG